MPALNEEATIGPCIRGIQELCISNHISGEIIVSDSSTDNTRAIAHSLGAMVVQPDKPGYGNAYLEGFRHSKNEIIVMMDSDGTYNPSEILQLVDPMKTGADLVIGSRFKGKIYPGAMAPLHRYIGNPSAYPGAKYGFSYALF